MFMFQTLKMIPAKIGFLDGELLGILGFSAAFAIWLLLPFLDPGDHGRRQRYVTGAGVFALGYVVVLTVYGYVVK